MSQLALVGTEIESVMKGFADDLFGLAVPASMRANANYPVRVNLSPEASLYVPKKDNQYLFIKDYCHVLQPWFWGDGGSSNILLTGETGTGKTSLIEQSAERLNWPVFRVGCHNAMEFQELVGRVTLNPDGSTGWADGPLILAMKLGGILLLDELNMIPNGAAGGLNTALDTCLDSGLSGLDLFSSMEKFNTNVKSRGGYCVPETGEIVVCHPCFRIAATGNGVDGSNKAKYRGVQTPNMALLDRFTLGIRMRYMSVDDEIAMLIARNPTANEIIVKSLCESALGIRSSYSAGVLGAVVSTRVLKAVVGRVVTNGDGLNSQLSGLSRSFEMCLFYRMDNVDAAGMKVAIVNLLKTNLGDLLPQNFSL